MTVALTFSVVAAFIRDPDGRVLLVRKRNTAAFMQPGGKREAGERMTSPRWPARSTRSSAAARSAVRRARSVYSKARRANEPGFRVQAAVYAVDVSGDIVPKAEIDEMIWVDPARPPAMPSRHR